MGRAHWDKRRNVSRRDAENAEKKIVCRMIDSTACGSSRKKIFLTQMMAKDAKKKRRVLSADVADERRLFAE
jgi:hypothetical protein